MCWGDLQDRRAVTGVTFWSAELTTPYDMTRAPSSSSTISPSLLPSPIPQFLFHFCIPHGACAGIQVVVSISASPAVLTHADLSVRFLLCLYFVLISTRALHWLLPVSA